MMKQEFEALAGYEVSAEDYNNIIEPMYMATNLNKAEFVKTINKKRFALKPLKSIVKEMKELAKSLEETCTHYTDYETKDKLYALAEEYIGRKYNLAGTQIASFVIIDETKFSCYYPKTIEVYGAKNYKTYETISLI